MCVDSWFLNPSDAEVDTGSGHFLPEQPNDFYLFHSTVDMLPYFSIIEAFSTITHKICCFLYIC